MKVNLDSIPSTIIALLQRNLGAGYLHRKVYLDTVNKKTICLGPNYVYIFNDLQCEDAEAEMYGIPYEVFKMGLKEGIMEVHEHKVRIGSISIATEPTIVGGGSKEQVLNSLDKTNSNIESQVWQELDSTTLDALKESKKFSDMKSDRSYIYINKDLVTVVHGSDFFALFEVNTPHQFALSSKASEILVANLGSMEISVDKHFIYFRCDGFYGATSNYTNGSHRFEDLPSRELINLKLGNTSDVEIFFDTKIKSKFKGLLTVLSDHIKNQNLVVKFRTAGLMIEDKRLGKTLGIIDGLEWTINGDVEIGLPVFLKLYSLLDNFQIRFPKDKGVSLGALTSSNITILLAMEVL